MRATRSITLAGVTQDTSALQVINPVARDKNCFAYDGRNPDAVWRHSAAAAEAHGEADELFRRYLPAQPKAVDASLVKHVPWETR